MWDDWHTLTSRAVRSWLSRSFGWEGRWPRTDVAPNRMVDVEWTMCCHSRNRIIRQVDTTHLSLWLDMLGNLLESACGWDRRARRCQRPFLRLGMLWHSCSTAFYFGLLYLQHEQVGVPCTALTETELFRNNNLMLLNMLHQPLEDDSFENFTDRW